MKILIYEVRTAKGMTLQELSQATGIGKTTLNNFENQATFPTLYQAELIAAALDTTITELFESKYK